MDRQPQDGWATQHSGDGLRLTCVRTADAHDLRRLPHVLTQRMPGAAATVQVDLCLDSEEPGARAGIAVLGDAFGWIGLQREPDGSVRLVHRFAETAAVGAPAVRSGRSEGERDAAPARPAPEGRARLWIEIGAGARCRFSYDVGGGRQPSGQAFAATPWRWVGALLGLFALAPTGGDTPEPPRSRVFESPRPPEGLRQPSSVVRPPWEPQ